MIYTGESPVVDAFCRSSFELLSDTEKQYLYHLSRAGVQSHPICLIQSPYHVPRLFALLLKVFKKYPIPELQQIFAKAGGSPQQFKCFIAYSASVFSNSGNYDMSNKKFIPKVATQVMCRFIELTLPPADIAIWNQIKEDVTRNDGQFQMLGWHGEGKTGYYSPKVTKQEVDLADQYLQEHKYLPQNTFVYKDGDEIVVKVVCTEDKVIKVEHKGSKLRLEFGYLKQFLQPTVEHLLQAKKFTERQFQLKMLDLYAEHFKTGDMHTHIRSQEVWVKDSDPPIQFNIGFIETYNDPKQIRGQWETVVAIMNKAESAKIARLLGRAEYFMNNLMPWDRELEKDSFLKPNFIGIEVVTVETSSPSMVGINLPNYDCVRQDIGFKNVYLSNNLPKPFRNTYLTEQDFELYKQHFQAVMFHQISYHELMGHGCGKMFIKKEDGSCNFNPEMIDPFTGKPVTCYLPGQTYHNVFKQLNNNMEESRAELIAEYFGCIPQAIAVLNPEYAGREAELTYCLILYVIQRGTEGITDYHPESKKWLQAHSNGRFIMLKLLLQSGIVVHFQEEKEGAKQHRFKVDRSKIHLAKDLFGQVLNKLNFIKATANVALAEEWFREISNPTELFLQIREIEVSNSRPRGMRMQGVVSCKEGKVEYHQFTKNHEGVIAWRLATHGPLLQKIEKAAEAMRQYFV